MPKTYTCQLEVRGYELDSFGHVNHAVYLNYLEHARWKMLEQEGITLQLITSLKRWPVIAAIEVNYLKPVFMNDPLEIHTRCVDHSRVRFTFEQTIFCRGTRVLSAKVTSVVVNETGRPEALPPEYQQLWAEENS